MKTKKNILVLSIITLIGIIIIILYLLILNLGYIKNKNILTPTGNVDIFEIDCNCADKTDKDQNENQHKNQNKEQNENERKDNSNSGDPAFKEENNLEVDENKPYISGLIVSDNYSIWGNEQARIFSNPSYEYTSKIAPGSFNSYTFIVKNNNDFDILVDFEIVEGNPYNVNMKYKLRSRGNYLVGDANNYDDISKLQLRNIKIKAHESIPYILDWKWIDSKNDTEIGEKIEVDYKLTINIGANQLY